MRSSEHETLGDERRYSIADKRITVGEEMAQGQDLASIKTDERTLPRQKPARPDAIDIARTFAVIIVGGLVGAVAVIVVFILLK